MIVLQIAGVLLGLALLFITLVIAPRNERKANRESSGR